MSSRGQHTPPCNSPYQLALKPSPAYPSPPPARNDSEPLVSARYPLPEGLGLYNFSPQFPTAPHQSHILFPPSPPSMTEPWSNNMSNGPSPLISEPIVDPHKSGAYQHPVCTSPDPWAPHYQASHRSSLSSPRDMSVFSLDGSEAGYSNSHTIKLEHGSGWNTDDEASLPGTVAPERLVNNNGMFSPYDNHYASPMMPSTPGPSHDGHHHAGAVMYLASSNKNTSSQRVRKRRATCASEIKFTCEICGQGFVRSYNRKTHMQRHDDNREKQYKCLYKDCTRKFDRKTDLERHNKSVHLKVRDHSCCKCGDSFSRNDTLRRHEYDGCQKKNQISPSQISRARSMYPSPRPDHFAPAGYHSAEAHNIYDSRMAHHSANSNHSNDYYELSSRF